MAPGVELAALSWAHYRDVRRTCRASFGVAICDPHHTCVCALGAEVTVRTALETKLSRDIEAAGHVAYSELVMRDPGDPSAQQHQAVDTFVYM